MNLTRLFFALLLCMGAISCEEENNKSMLGEWTVTWTSDGHELIGLIEFSETDARLKAFGNEDCIFLRSYTEMNYSWSLLPEKLILYPKGNSLHLEYKILEQNHNMIRLRYLDSIDVSFMRN